MKAIGNKYAAQILYQFRVVIDGRNSKRRITQSSIVIIHAKSPEIALKSAQRQGKKNEYKYLNDKGNEVFFECIGIQELLHLGVECDENEVWYEVKERMSPMENKNKFIPKQNDLNAFKH